MHRLIRHALLAAASAAVAGLAYALAPPALGLDRASLAISWLCLLLFSAALAVGPLHTLRTGRVLANHLLRRDLGIWCALNGLAHLAISFDISMNPGYLQLFVDGATSWPAPGVRRQMYMWAVIGSLVIAAVFVLLLGLSSNLAMRLVGPTWWKRLQRGSYLAFGLTVAHAAAFQIIESRTTWLMALLGLLTLLVVLAQAAGRARVRRAAVSLPGRRSPASARETP